MWPRYVLFVFFFTLSLSFGSAILYTTSLSVGTSPAGLAFACSPLAPLLSYMQIMSTGYSKIGEDVSVIVQSKDCVDNG